MKKVFLLVIAITGWLLAVHQPLAAQEEIIANKLFYTELGGPSVIMSANFDARFKTGERLGFGYRLGIGFGYNDGRSYYSINDEYSSRTYYSFPLGLNYVFGKPNSAHTFDVGAGITILTRKVALFYYERTEPGHVIMPLTFMYRLMPVNGGFSFRVGLTPIIGTGGDLFPMGAVGFGYAF